VGRSGAPLSARAVKIAQMNQVPRHLSSGAIHQRRFLGVWTSATSRLSRSATPLATPNRLFHGSPADHHARVEDALAIASGLIIPAVGTQMTGAHNRCARARTSVCSSKVQRMRHPPCSASQTAMAPTGWRCSQPPTQLQARSWKGSVHAGHGRSARDGPTTPAPRLSPPRVAAS